MYFEIELYNCDILHLWLQRFLMILLWNIYGKLVIKHDSHSFWPSWKNTPFLFDFLDSKTSISVINISCTQTRWSVSVLKFKHLQKLWKLTESARLPHQAKAGQQVWGPILSVIWTGRKIFWNFGQLGKMPNWPQGLKNQPPNEKLLKTKSSYNIIYDFSVYEHA